MGAPGWGRHRRRFGAPPTPPMVAERRGMGVLPDFDLYGDDDFDPFDDDEIRLIDNPW